MFSRILTRTSMKSFSDNIESLKEVLDNADAIVIGAGAGLSASAGFDYTGERFDRYFHDFGTKYHFSDMYSGGFYPYGSLEEYWAYWSRYIYINRYMKAPIPVYDKLYSLVKDRDYFVLTTNVDHCFQKAGFDKHRLFYTQGDYGLLQCSEPCCQETFDNEDIIREMLMAQGYYIKPDQTLGFSTESSLRMSVPAKLIPHCVHCGKPLTMNLRCDDTFVEDEGWHIAAERYSDFLRRHKNVRTVFLELAVGYNTPAIIKYSFWRMVNDRENATYVCVNNGEAYAPDEIKNKSVCINADIGEILSALCL